MKAYTIGLYEKAMPADLTWKEKLQAAKEAGYDFVEISIDETEEKIQRIYMPKEERLKMIEHMFEVGIPIRSMCVSALTRYSLGNSDEKLCNRGMEILEKALELADDLGIRIVMIPGYDVYYEESTAETTQRFIKNLKKATKIAAKYGILIELETMENSFMNTVWKAMFYVKQIDSAYLGIYPDSGNMKNAAVLLGVDEAQDLMAGKGHITSLHLKESVPGKYREIPYGEGHVDFEKIIHAAWAIGIRKYVTEFWYKGSPDWKEDLINANRKMRAILDKADKVCVEA
ncbi:L-ribulose-5-phosphate 4-epimerase [Sporanaerobium hydrogeniformans]|uniref:L-ribulose-5-phosphate 4-epimerase n=1 Tax=Sporanaerobium hydrogeniformans TaxID=3072179 RepID=A0AC61D888_9FIRM|nr:L-ribulose-5-phosphate 3-epimerase [Sporanaerobium hydrogeniformans]PHV69646.1 L-ribulose-5-phosphate 4-epimerase [Sporanaerobium hydrogeniformans]